MAITAGCSRVPNRRASTLSSGRRAEGEQREHRVDASRITATASTVHAFEIVSGIITRNCLHLVEVGVGPAHQLPGLGLVVVGEVQPLEVGEHAVAQVGLGPRATRNAA